MLNTEVLKVLIEQREIGISRVLDVESWKDSYRDRFRSTFQRYILVDVLLAEMKRITEPGAVYRSEFVQAYGLNISVL